MNATLLPNPSHLEAINPVALGYIRKNIEKGKKAFGIQLHGDAAFSGQGVVMESLSLSQLPDYCVGGTIHVIANNQLGFTADSVSGRSTTYSSDVAKTIDIPVIHVNADCPESVLQASVLASKYRLTFQKDIVLDVIGFRIWGHNELDEPSFTQPQMYQSIRSRQTIPQKYAAKLVEQGIVSSEEVSEFRSNFYNILDKEKDESVHYVPQLHSFQSHLSADRFKVDVYPKTVDLAENNLKEIAKISVSYPEYFVS